MSIVLVIVGLLIGGVLVGQSLIESAKINAQIRQFQRYDIAIEQFKQKFKQIPGDCNKCAGVGDGDARLESGWNVFPPHIIGGETNSFWSDLSRMAMIKENYIYPANGRDFDIGEGKQFPKAKLGANGSGIWVTSDTSRNLHYQFIWGGLSNGAGAWTNCGGGFLCTATLTTVQAASLDAKSDDSLPGSGNIVSISASDSVVISSDSSSSCMYNSTYNTNYSGNICRLSIKVGTN